VTPLPIGREDGRAVARVCADGDDADIQDVISDYLAVSLSR